MGFMRDLWNFLVWPEGEAVTPPLLAPTSLSEVWDDMQQEITRIKPNLAMEWRKMFYEDPYAAGIWLDGHFPIPGGWGHHLIMDGPRILRHCYPSHGPVDPSHCP